MKKMVRPIIPGSSPTANRVTARSSTNVPHTLPALRRVNRRAGAPGGAAPAMPPPPEPPLQAEPPPLPLAPPPADAPPAVAPAPAPLPPADPPMFDPAVAAEPPPVPVEPPPAAEAPVVESAAAEEAAHELEKDADQAGAAEDKLSHLKGMMAGKLGGDIHEGPRIQAAIEGFVASERANLHNLETELENAALA